MATRGRPRIQIHLTTKERKSLILHSRSELSKNKQRANIILCRAKGMSQAETAKLLNCALATVIKWTSRFKLERLQGLCLDKKSPDKTTSETENASTLRSVAKEAGVSIATVSRVFNQLPGVRKEVREKVWTVTHQMGYQPDPELKKLMIHLRKHHSERSRGKVCSLESTAWRPGFDAYFRAVVAGAREKARTLGFSWESFPLEEIFTRPQAIARQFYNRGVEGIFIPPAPLGFIRNRPHLPAELNWGKFSVVVATYLFSSSSFRRVVPDHFKNMLLICQSLTQAGYKNLGLVIPDELDAVSRREFSGAFAAHHIEHQKAMLPVHYYAGDLLDDPFFSSWFENTNPDALILNSGYLAERLAAHKGWKFPAPVGMAVMAMREPSSSGIEQLSHKIGSIAMEQLGNMIIHGERGIPPFPTTLMVEGIWHPGLTAPPINIKIQK